MEKGYIILAHQNPTQLCRLLQRLDDGHSTFFIHIDKKITISDFNGILEFGDKVMLVKREVTNWAEFGLIEATINALKSINETGKDFDRIILLSGQDYPIKANALIDQFFATSTSKVFIESVIIPDFSRWKPGGGMYRVNQYFFGLKKFQRYSAKALNFLGIMLPFVKRKQVDNMLPFAGSQWWIIDMYALAYILQFIKENRAYYNFHKSTFAPDELFFHGILLNSVDKQLADSICNDHKRFMNWDDTSRGHPEILRKADLAKIVQSDALFARKFDQCTDEEILDLIDSVCLTGVKSGEPMTIENHYSEHR